MAAVIEGALSALGRFAGHCEVIVSDDGSEDGTREIAESYARRRPGVVRVVGQRPNRGYGHALRLGLGAARYEWVFVTDGDGQFDLGEMGKLVPFLHDHDVVTGYRRVRRDPAHRRLAGTAWNLLGRVLLDLPVRDVDCAFRFYRRALLERIPLVSNGAMVSMELCARARQLGARVREVEVTHRPRLAGRASGARPRVVLRALRELAVLYPTLRAASLPERLPADVPELRHRRA